MKKISCSLMAVVILLFSLLLNASAADNEVNITYAKANLPEITINAEIGGGVNSIADVQLVLDGKVINTSSIEKYSPETASRRVFFLIDLSTSMTDKYFTQAKACVNDFVDNMGSNTTVYVISFGKEINCAVNGSKNKTEIKEAVNSLSNNQGGTKFFASIKEAINISKDCEIVDSEYMVVFSDGEDFQTGDTTQKEVESELENSIMPIYAMRANTNKVNNDDIGAFRELTAKSHGEFYSYSASDAEGVFSEMMNKINSQYVIHGNASSNMSNGAAQPLYIKVNGVQSKTINVMATSISDADSPEIISEPIISKEDRTMSFEFSEAIINDAGTTPTKDDISIKTEKGKELEITDVTYTEADGKYILTVAVKGNIVKDNYILGLKGITDKSTEKNTTVENYSFTSDIGISKFTSFLISFWYIFVIILVVLLLIVIMLVMMRRKNVKKVKELFIDENIKEVEVKHIVKSESGVKLKLLVDSGSGVIKAINTQIVGSSIFGRANLCNVIFDDTKMSRQHFCIGLKGDKLVLSDLETTNGTYLNGVKVKEPQVIKVGDKIFAGLSTITVETIDK